MSIMVPIDILHLFAYEGPNIFGPQPGVLLRVRCAGDYSLLLKERLKDSAQLAGVTLAYLDITTTQQGDGFVIGASFTTHPPAIGAALAALVVEGMQATMQGDEAWDGDTPLFQLQKRRRQEAPPVAVLRLIAEARTRDIPVLFLADGTIQFGYGCRGWRFDPAAYAASSADEADAPPPPPPPWDDLGSIPIYAVSGEHNRSAVVQEVAAQLHAQGYPISTLDDADYDATRALLSNPTTRQAVIGLRTADILRRGVAFSRCRQSIITDIQGVQPAEAADTVEWVRALGVPMLVSTAPTILNTEDPRIASLAAYAPYGVLPLTTLDSMGKL